MKTEKEIKEKLKELSKTKNNLRQSEEVILANIDMLLWVLMPSEKSSTN